MMNRMVAGFLAAIVAGVCGAQDWQPPGGFELQAMPGAHAEVWQSRVGQTFWVQRKGRPFSIDFFSDPGLRDRYRVEGTRRFVVVAATLTGEARPVYQIEFDSGEPAFVAVDAFESELYVDPPLTSETRLKASPYYLSPEAYFYSIKSIFSEDPVALGTRIERLGPSRIFLPDALQPSAAPPR